jgi:hypothetical protein
LPVYLSHEVVELKRIFSPLRAAVTGVFSTVGCTLGYLNDALSGLAHRIFSQIIKLLCLCVSVVKRENGLFNKP